MQIDVKKVSQRIAGMGKRIDKVIGVFNKISNKLILSHEHANRGN